MALNLWITNSYFKIKGQLDTRRNRILWSTASVNYFYNQFKRMQYSIIYCGCNFIQSSALLFKIKGQLNTRDVQIKFCKAQQVSIIFAISLKAYNITVFTGQCIQVKLILFYSTSRIANLEPWIISGVEHFDPKLKALKSSLDVQPHPGSLEINVMAFSLGLNDKFSFHTSSPLMCYLSCKLNMRE